MDGNINYCKALNCYRLAKKTVKKHWTKISSKNKKCGRKITKKEIRDLIYEMAAENNWGAPRIYSELLMLGYTKNEISQPTLSRYLRRSRSNNPDNKICFFIM